MMRRFQKKNASRRGGGNFTKRAGRVNSQINVLHCGVHHISKLRQELANAGLGLLNASGDAQISMLLRLLKYLGNRGINTLEAVGCGYYRVATRIQELEAAGHLIASKRESVIGADGLEHRGIARYELLIESVVSNPQLEIDLGVSL